MVYIFFKDAADYTLFASFAVSEIVVTIISVSVTPYHTASKISTSYEVCHQFGGITISVRVLQINVHIEFATD